MCAHTDWTSCPRRQCRHGSHPLPPAHRRRRRTPVRGAVTLVAVALAAATVSGTVATAQAATPTTDLETTVLRLSGPALSAGALVPAGTTLTPVRLTTSDPDTSVSDGASLTTLKAGFSSKRPRFVVPDVPAEPVTFRVDGTTVATTVPDSWAVSLPTDAGTVPALVFTAQGVSYALPRRGAPVEGATTTLTAARLNKVGVTGNLTYDHGLLPVGAEVRNGRIFQEELSYDRVLGVRTGGITVYDADDVRGNADTATEEVAVEDLSDVRFNTTGIEVKATVSLHGGGTATVRAVRYDLPMGYGSVRTTWVFERAALAAAGRDVGDVTGVLSSSPTDYDLTWSQLGIDLR